MAYESRKLSVAELNLLAHVHELLAVVHVLRAFRHHVDMIQNHVDLLSGKVHAVPTRSTVTAADAAAIIRDMCLRSGDGFPDVRVLDHAAKFTSEVFRAFVKGWGSCLIVGSAYHKKTNSKAERANGVISDNTLRACANGRKDDWDSHQPLAVFDVLGGAPAGTPPDRGMELELETRGVPMPRCACWMASSRSCVRS